MTLAVAGTVACTVPAGVTVTVPVTMVLVVPVASAVRSCGFLHFLQASRVHVRACFPKVPVGFSGPAVSCRGLPVDSNGFLRGRAVGVLWVSCGFCCVGMLYVPEDFLQVPVGVLWAPVGFPWVHAGFV